MKILFSPSESKSLNCNEAKINENSFIFKDLFAFRIKALRHYENFVKNADLKALQELFGVKNENELEKYKNELKNSPTQKAITLYTGVSFEYLNYNSLSLEAKNYVTQNTIIFSNLFGPVSANDNLPFYKFKQGAKIKDFNIEKFYKEHFSKSLDKFLENEEILDLRASFYDKFYTPNKAFYSYKFIKNGKVVSHFAKAYRGILLRICAKILAQNNKELLKNLPSNLKLKEIQIRGLKEEIILEILD